MNARRSNDALHLDREIGPLVDSVVEAVERNDREAIPPQVNTRKRGSLRLAGVVLLGLVAVVMSACYPDHPQSTFDIAGPVARSQLTLFYWIFWAAVFVFVTVGGALIYVAIRFRRRPGDGDPVQTHGHTKLEIAWTIAPALILVVVAIPTILTVFDNANSPDPDGLTVEATAHQWWFEFRYPHPTNENEQIVFANELHLPVNKVVNVNLHSEDVIHSFWIPKIAGKVDMVPNNDNNMWIQSEQLGEFYGQCAEFCGESHSKMKFRVIVESQEDFDQWLLAQAAPAVEPVTPLQVKGSELFRSAGCSGCHATSAIMNLAPDGSQLKGRRGPNLTHVASRGRLGAGELPQNPESFRLWVSDPGSVKPGNIMATEGKPYVDPDSALSEQDVSALVAYLRSLK